MTVELEYLEQKKKELMDQIEQVKANANAITGALQLVNHLIDKAKEVLVAAEPEKK